MDELVDSYLRSKRIGLFEQASIDELRNFSRNWQSFMEQFYSQGTEEAVKAEPVRSGVVARVSEQESNQRKIDELADIIAKAEEMLAKSSQTTDRRKSIAQSTSTNAVRTSELKTNLTRQSSTESLASAKPVAPRNSRLAPSPARTLRPSISQTNLASVQKPVYTNAPYKTQNLNLLGNKKPVPRPPVVATTTRTVVKSGSAGASFTRSSSASSIKNSLAALPSPVQEVERLESHREARNAPTTSSQAQTAKNEARVEKSNQEETSMLNKELDARASQMETVKSIQNSLKENFELKRRVLTASRKPSSSRASFLKKCQRPGERSGFQVEVIRSSDAFKLHQASLLYQRLRCLVLREIFSDNYVADEGEEKHLEQFNRLSYLLEKMKKLDRLIKTNLRSSKGENKLLVDFAGEEVRAFVRRNLIFPLLARKLAEIYFERSKEVAIYAELRCQRMELDFSNSLLVLVKSASLKSLDDIYLRTLHSSREDMVAFIQLLNSLVHFISSKRTVFVDQRLLASIK